MIYAGAITSALVILAAFVFFYISGFLSYYGYSAKLSISLLDSVIETVAVALGIAISYKLFIMAKPTGETKTRLYYALFNSVLVNSAYAYIAKAIMYFAEGINVLDELIYGFFASGGLWLRTSAQGLL